MSKVKSPVSLKIQNDNTNIILPLSIMFLGIVVSVTLILLVLA